MAPKPAWVCFDCPAAWPAEWSQGTNLDSFLNKQFSTEIPKSLLGFCKIFLSVGSNYLTFTSIAHGFYYYPGGRIQKLNSGCQTLGSRQTRNTTKHADQVAERLSSLPIFTWEGYLRAHAVAIEPDLHPDNVNLSPTLGRVLEVKTRQACSFSKSSLRKDISAPSLQQWSYKVPFSPFPTTALLLPQEFWEACLLGGEETDNVCAQGWTINKKSR